MESKINLRILREGKPAIYESVERGTMTFGSLFKKYPFPPITEEKMKRSRTLKTAAFPVLFVNEHTFIGTPEVDNFITENRPVEELISGPSLVVQMRYRVPIIERPAFYGRPAAPEENPYDYISLSADLGVPESYWDDFG